MTKKESVSVSQPPRWRWLVSWMIVQPLAATPLVMMVYQVGPFGPPFVANGLVVMPAILVAVSPIAMLVNGFYPSDPAPRA